MTFRRASAGRERLRSCRLYLIGGPAPGAGHAAREDFLARVRAAVEGGVDAVQVRMKGALAAELAEVARALRAALHDRDVALVVNDSLEAALAAEADGVHVGQDDEAPESLRRRLASLRRELSIGLSTHSPEQAAAAKARGADVVGYGAMFATATKASPEVIGPGRLAEAIAAARVPLFPIGGIAPHNVHELVARGAARAAVSSAVLLAADPRAAARALRAALERHPLEPEESTS